MSLIESKKMDVNDSPSDKTKRHNFCDPYPLLTLCISSTTCSLFTVVFQGGEKVVCGNGEGVLYIFNWGEWGNMSDRFPGHPESVDCIVPINDDIICTGSMDGKIR